MGGVILEQGWCQGSTNVMSEENNGGQYDKRRNQYRTLKSV